MIAKTLDGKFVIDRMRNINRIAVGIDDYASSDKRKLEWAFSAQKSIAKCLWASKFVITNEYQKNSEDKNFRNLLQASIIAMAAKPRVERIIERFSEKQG